MSSLPLRARAELALVAVTFIWGWSFVIVKNVLGLLPPFVFLSLRFGLAAIVLVILFRGRFANQAHLWRPTLRAGGFAGLCLFAGYVFQTTGLRYTSPSKSAFITGLTMAVVPFLVSIVYRKAPHSSEVMGVAVATLGLGLLTLPPDRLRISFGDLLTLCCTFGFACHILVLGHWASRAAWELLSLTQIAVTGVLSLIAASFTEAVRIPWNREVIGAVLFTGVLATAIPFSVQSWAQRHTTPMRAALIFALEPVWASLASYVLTGELLTGRALAGAVLILAGVLLVELKPWGRVQHPLA
ncbi:MAG: DMT family transporter [Bryobacterales bacterium]|nr:DMT family transporter [Bryobacterales bacterium]